MNYLEKKYRGGAAIEYDFDETVQLAIAALQVWRRGSRPGPGVGVTQTLA